MKAIQAIPNAPKMYLLQSAVKGNRYLHIVSFNNDGYMKYRFKKGEDGAALFTLENANLLLAEIGEDVARLKDYVPVFNLPTNINN